MEDSNPPKYVAAAFWGMVLAAPLPGVAVYLAWLSELEQYGYVYPLLLALLALILFRWDFQFRFPSELSSISLVFSGMTLSLLAAYRASPWLSALAFSISATAWLRSHLSSSPDRHRLTYLSLLLLMIIRLPLNFDLRLAASLQRTTSRVSSYLLDSFGVTHYLRGNVIELPGGTLFVEEACGGVQSLFTMLFIVCLWIVFRRRPLVATPAYLMAGVVWAMVMNIVRITSIALAQEWYDADLSAGTAHEILGWICLFGAVLMMLSSDRLLRVCFFPVPPDESGYLGNPIARLWNWTLSFGVPEDRDNLKTTEVEVRIKNGALRPPLRTALIVAASVVCLPSLAFGYRVIATRFDSRLASNDKPLLWAPDASLMSNTEYSAVVTNHESLRDANSKQLGNHADVWTVVIDGTPVRIAVSQPYPEWHDMRLCYSGNGWQVNDWKPTLEPIDVGDKAKQEEVSDRETRQIDRWVVSYAEMVRDTGEFGTLLFCGLSSGGDLLSPPMVGIYSMFDDRIKDRSTLRSNIIMLQLWAETEKPLIPEQMRKLRSLFNSFRIRVLNELSYASESLTPEQRLNVTIVTKGGINR